MSNLCSSAPAAANNHFVRFERKMMLILGGIKKATVRAVIVPLRRPVIADIGEFRTWPLILTDIELDNGVVGCSYIAPYRSHAVPSVVAEIHDIVEQLAKRSAPFEGF